MTQVPKTTSKAPKPVRDKQSAKTDRGCQEAKVPEGKKETNLSAGGGLYMRVRRGKDGKQAKEWYYWYTSPLSNPEVDRPKLFFGSYPEMGLAEARGEAAKYKVQVKVEKRDPKVERDQSALLTPLVEDMPTTFGELFQLWKERELSTHSDKGAYAAGMMERHAVPYLGKLLLSNLRHSVIAAVLDKLVLAGKKNTAGRVLGFIRQMCGYAIERDWMTGDPTATMKKAKWVGKRVKRKRVLAQEEIVMLATEKLPTAELSPELECALWIQLACASRIEETTRVRETNVNFETGIWYIPPEDQKKTHSGQRPHWVDLSPFALKWFKRLTELPHERAIRANNRLPKHKQLAVVPEPQVNYLLPSYRRGDGPINHKTPGHAIKDRQKPGTIPKKGRTRLVDAFVLPGGPWTSQDLRRTAATAMGELGIPFEVVERVLNHVSSDDLQQTYQHAKLRPQMKHAWLALGEVLEKLVTRQPKDVGYLDYDTDEDLDALEAEAETEVEVSGDEDDEFAWLNEAPANANEEEDI